MEELVRSAGGVVVSRGDSQAARQGFNTASTSWDLSDLALISQLRFAPSNPMIGASLPRTFAQDSSLVQPVNRVAWIVAWRRGRSRCGRHVAAQSMGAAGLRESCRN